MDALSPDMQQLYRLVLALGLVLGLMGGLSLLLKKLGLVSMPTVKKGKKKRLSLIESLPLDARRRAVIIECDQKQYLVILGANGETVIDNALSPVDSSEKMNAPSS